MRIVEEAHNVKVLGADEQTIILTHSFGSEQSLWKQIVPHLVHDHRVVLFDNMGAGTTNLDYFDFKRYSTLEGYAYDVLAILEALQIQSCIFVGHSISAMIGVIASVARPDLFSKLVLIADSRQKGANALWPIQGQIKSQGLANPASNSSGPEMLSKPSVHPSGAKLVLPSISVGKPDMTQTAFSGNNSAFTFPFSTPSGILFEPPTPSILPFTTASSLPQQNVDPAVPSYSFGNKNSSPPLVFSFSSTSSIQRSLGLHSAAGGEPTETNSSAHRSFIDLPKDLFEMLSCAGPYLCRDTLLLQKLCRVLRGYYLSALELVTAGDGALDLGTGIIGNRTPRLHLKEARLKASSTLS